MSWDVTLEDENGKPLKVKPHTEGGTYVMGGTDDAELNVTWNYGKYLGFGEENTFIYLDGKKASDVIDMLQSAVDKLGTDKDKDYWAVTPGNAGHTLNILLTWAKQHPNGIFRIV